MSFRDFQAHRNALSEWGQSRYNFRQDSLTVRALRPVRRLGKPTGISFTNSRQNRSNLPPLAIICVQRALRQVD